MTLDELESAWISLPLPTARDGISGRRASGLPADRAAYLAVDSRSRRHLLVQAPDDCSPVIQRDTRSLEVTTSRFQVGVNPEALYVDLICTDSTQHHTFSAIAQDILRSVRHSPGPLRDTIMAALSRWRAFWAVRAGAMSREDALGLFGELWFLRRWLGAVSSVTIDRWQAIDQARHDFQWPAASVEVKTAATQNSGRPTHHIASLEQLADPEQGALYLFSLQVCDDALAANTLHSLVSALTVELQADFHALARLNEKLAARGYTPADQQAPARTLRILAERLYRIDAHFPRLTRTHFAPIGVPAAIVGVEYSLDLAGCEAWVIATSPTDGEAAILSA